MQPQTSLRKSLHRKALFQDANSDDMKDASTEFMKANPLVVGWRLLATRFKRWTEYEPISNLTNIIWDGIYAIATAAALTSQTGKIGYLNY